MCQYWHSRVITKDAAPVSTGVRCWLYKRLDPVDFSLVGVSGLWNWKSLSHLSTTTTTTFSGLFSRATWVSRYQKGKPFWI